MADDGITERLEKQGDISFERIIEKQSIFSVILSWVIPIALMAVLWIFIMRSMQKMQGGGGVMSFGKNTAKIYAETITGISFRDVAGQDEAKESLQEIVGFIKSPEKYVAIGAKLPKGALLVGPSWDRKDPACQSGGKRGRRTLFLDYRFRFC